jgi:hypothetical protein
MDMLLLLLKVLIGNDAFFDLLVLKGHFLDVLTNFIDPSPQPLVHFFVARSSNDIRAFILHMAVDLVLDLVSLLSHLVELTIQLVSCLQQAFNFDYFGTNVISL